MPNDYSFIVAWSIPATAGRPWKYETIVKDDDIPKIASTDVIIYTRKLTDEECIKYMV